MAGPIGYNLFVFFCKKYNCVYVRAGDRREPADRAPDYKTVLEEGELSVQNAL